MGSYRIKDYDQKRIAEIGCRDRVFLRKIANRSIKDLCKDNPELLVFPEKLNFHNDDIEDKFICTLSKEHLKADCILGFVGNNETQLTICTRFAEDDKEDLFLHYLVQKVFNINLFDIRHSKSYDKVFDFLACIFPFYLKKALAQGLFKQYRTREFNDSNIRGSIDLPRHIRCNTPFAGKMAYRIREFSYDNSVTQLIRHTIEYIKSSSMCRVLKSCPTTVDCVLQICNATRSYRAQDHNIIIRENTRPVKHPYFTEYTLLQKLCLSILKHDKLKYGTDSDKIYGLLFNGHWLWEEYLHTTVMSKCGFSHPRNNTREGAIYIFENKKGKRYPDYLQENIIIDAKYKHLDNDDIDRNDMNQIITYMHITKADYGGFIYPNNKICCEDEVEAHSLGHLQGCGGTIYNIGVPIPVQAESFRQFAQRMEGIEKRLADEISRILINNTL